MSSEEQSVDKVVAEEVIDIDHDETEVQQWYDEAGASLTPEALQKLVERVLSAPKMTPATTPHAYASIALASLKMANASQHGKLNSEQWGVVKSVLLGILDEVIGV
jgi:hypothetical protein